MTLWATAFLVFIRVGALLLNLPIFSAQGVPRYVPLLVALALTVLIAPGQPVLANGESLAVLALALGSEVILGALLGMIVSAVFSAVALGTEIASQQMGLSMASMFDPLTNSNAGLVGTIASMLAGLMFISAGLHLRFVELVARSFEVIPVGLGGLPTEGAPAVTLAIGQAITLGVQLAGPVLVLVWAINVFVGILARLAPSMNVFFSVGMSAGSVVGLLIFSVSLPYMLAAHEAALRDTVSATWRLLLAVS